MDAAPVLYTPDSRAPISTCLSLDMYQIYLHDPCAGNLRRAYNATVPIVKAAVDFIGLSGFDAAAAETEAMDDIYMAIEKKSLGNGSLNPTLYGAYIFVIARNACLRYKRAGPDKDWRRIPDTDRSVIRTLYMDRIWTENDMDMKIFFEDELPMVMRRHVVSKIRFNGQYKQFCIEVLRGLTEGISVSKIEPKTHVHKGREFLKRYTAYLVREYLKRFVPKYMDDPKAPRLRRVWDATEYRSYERVTPLA